MIIEISFNFLYAIVIPMKIAVLNLANNLSHFLGF